MVNIEVIKGLLIMLQFELFLMISHSNQKLSIFNIPRTIQIDQPHDGFQPFFIFYMLLHDCFELIQRDYSIVVSIAFLEYALQPVFLGFA